MKKSAHIYTFYGIAVVVLLLVLYVFVHKRAVYNPVVEMKRSAMLDELEEEKKKKEEKQRDEEQWKDRDRKDAEQENTERAGNVGSGMNTPYDGMAARDMYTNMYGMPPVSTPANEYYYPGMGSLPQDEDSYTAVQPQFNNAYTGPMGPSMSDNSGQMSKETEGMLDSLVQDPMFNLTMFMGMLNRIRDENKHGADEDDSKSYVKSRFIPPTLITLPGRYNLGLKRPGESIFGENVGTQLGVDSVSTGTNGPLGSSYESMPGARTPNTDSRDMNESSVPMFGENKKVNESVPTMFSDMGVLSGDDNKDKDKKKKDENSILPPPFTGTSTSDDDKDKDKKKKDEKSVLPSPFSATSTLSGDDKNKDKKKKDEKSILPPHFTGLDSDNGKDDGNRKGSDDALFLPLDGMPTMDRNGGDKSSNNATSSIFGIVSISDDKKDEKNKKNENNVSRSLTNTNASGKDDKDKDKKKKDEKSVLPSPFSAISTLSGDDKDKDKKKKDENSILPPPFTGTSSSDDEKDKDKKKKDEKSVLPSPFSATSILDKDGKKNKDKKKKKDETSILPSPFSSVLGQDDEGKKKEKNSTSVFTPSSILDKDKEENRKDETRKDENNASSFTIFNTKHPLKESNNGKETLPSSQDRASGTEMKASDRTNSNKRGNEGPMASNGKTKDKKQKDEQPMVDRIVKQAIFVAIGSSGDDKGYGRSGDSKMNGDTGMSDVSRNGTTSSSDQNTGTSGVSRNGTTSSSDQNTGTSGVSRNGTTTSSPRNSTYNQNGSDTMNRSVPFQNDYEDRAEQDLLNFSVLGNNLNRSSPSTDKNLLKDTPQEKTHKKKQKDEGKTGKRFLNSYDLFSSMDNSKKDERGSTETATDKYDVTGGMPANGDTLLTNGGIIKPENSLTGDNELEGSTGRSPAGQKTSSPSNKVKISANYTESTPIFRDLPVYTNKNKKSKPRSKQVVPIIKFKELKDEMDGMDRLIDEVKDIREMKERSFDDMIDNVARASTGPDDKKESVGSIAHDSTGSDDKKENGSDKSETFDLGEKLAFRKVSPANTSSDSPAVVVTPEQPAVNQEKNQEVKLTVVPSKHVHRKIKHKSHKKQKNAQPKKSEPAVNEQGFFDFFMPGTNTSGDNKDQGERTSRKHHKGKKKHKTLQAISNEHDDNTPEDEHMLVMNGYQKTLQGGTLRTGQEKVKRETKSRNVVEINGDDYGKEMTS